MMHEDITHERDTFEMAPADVMRTRNLSAKTMTIPSKRKSKLKVMSLLTTIFIVLLLVSFTEAKKKRAPNCNVCKKIADNFNKGVERTKKSGYGGGNTDWEEKSLGQYANSEVRLVEIQETLCEGDTKECHQLLEEFEEVVEDFWFKSGLEKSYHPFFQYFCIDTILACCPNNTWGPDCKDCTGGTERPCKGNGVCNGEGTREGNGKCKCNSGYEGKLCDNCKSGYFADMKNDTHTNCKLCHIACKDACTADGAIGCVECGNGWVPDEKEGCRDINECSAEESPCKDDQYCTNSMGSYACLSCNSACIGCSGSGPDKCNTCNDGYVLNETTCLDVNECEGENGALLCKEANETCENTPGSYRCVCPTGYERKGAGCEIIPKEGDSEEQTQDQDAEKTTKEEL